MAIRRVVTGRDGTRGPVVLFDGPAPAETVMPPEVGATLTDLWRSDTVPLDTLATDDATAGAFELMPAGALFRVIDLEAGTREPLWHATASVDFNYVVTGQVTVLLGDEGGPVTEIDLAAGDTLVHRGPRHAWVNRGTSTCRLVCSSIAARVAAD
jgi:hypothetical protein